MGWTAFAVGRGLAFRFEVEAWDIARLVVAIKRVLNDVYGAPHPVFIAHGITGASGTLSDPESLDTARTAWSRSLSTNPSLIEQVAAVLATMPRAVLQSASARGGVFRILYNLTKVFVEVKEDPPLVEVFTPVLTNVPASERLQNIMSELRHLAPRANLYHSDATVWVSVSCGADRFSPTELVLAVSEITRLAAELGDRLRREFGDTQFFSAQ